MSSPGWLTIFKIAALPAIKTNKMRDSISIAEKLTNGRYRMFLIFYSTAWATLCVFLVVQQN
jgi:hypothetical protein